MGKRSSVLEEEFQWRAQKFKLLVEVRNTLFCLTDTITVDAHYLLMVLLCRWATISCDQFEPTVIWKNCVVNYIVWYTDMHLRFIKVTLQVWKLLNFSLLLSHRRRVGCWWWFSYVTWCWGSTSEMESIWLFNRTLLFQCFWGLGADLYLPPNKEDLVCSSKHYIYKHFSVVTFFGQSEVTFSIPLN